MHFSQRGGSTPGLHVHSPVLGSQRVPPPEGTEPTGWQEQAVKQTGERTREAHVNISVMSASHYIIQGRAKPREWHPTSLWKQKRQSVVLAQTNQAGTNSCRSSAAMWTLLQVQLRTTKLSINLSVFQLPPAVMWKSISPHFGNLFAFFFCHSCFQSSNTGCLS